MLPKGGCSLETPWPEPVRFRTRLTAFCISGQQAQRTRWPSSRVRESSSANFRGTVGKINVFTPASNGQFTLTREPSRHDRDYTRWIHAPHEHGTSEVVLDVELLAG